MRSRTSCVCVWHELWSNAAATHQKPQFSQWKRKLKNSNECANTFSPKVRTLYTFDNRHSNSSEIHISLCSFARNNRSRIKVIDFNSTCVCGFIARIKYKVTKRRENGVKRTLRWKSTRKDWCNASYSVHIARFAIQKRHERQRIYNRIHTSLSSPSLWLCACANICRYVLVINDFLEFKLRNENWMKIHRLDPH